MPSDLELLEIEIGTLWLLNEEGRLLRSRHAQGWAAPYMVVGAAKDGWTLAFSSDVTDALAREVQAMFDGEPPAVDPSQPPRLFARCERLLVDALGPTEISSGPSFVIPPGTSFASDAAILKSDEPAPSGLSEQDFERINWTAKDWQQLIEGNLGPWAFVMNGDQVVSLCHSARLTDRGAEAGTWTDPDCRGRGYAAGATAAWAELLEPSGRHFFYSTSADNVSSQRVAERLKLPHIGRMWRIAPKPM